MADPFKARQDKLSLSLALPMETLDIKSQYFNITLCCLWCPVDGYPDFRFCPKCFAPWELILCLQA